MKLELPYTEGIRNKILEKVRQVPLPQNVPLEFESGFKVAHQQILDIILKAEL